MENDPLVGEDLAGFRVVRRLGAGAMGVVYEAQDLSLMRAVALKVLPEALTREPEQRLRLLREARAAAAVTHPAVATIYQVGDTGQQVFIAMELVPGRTLRERLESGALPAREVIAIGAAIAAGLERAHGAGVVHRDIKPDNVIVTPQGQVKLLDFGVARVVDAAIRASIATDEGIIVGSPGYMAPEQARGARLDGRADLFALGVVLYELLSGQRPFGGATAMDAIVAALRDPHRSLQETHPGLPLGLSELIDRCLAKDPDDRPASATEVGAALAAIAQGPARDDHAALAMSTLGGAPPLPARRRRWPFVLAGGAVLAAALSATIIWTMPADPVPLPQAMAAAPSVSPLSAPESVLACPVLEVVGGEAPNGWLGGAAAQQICDRATVLLGGRTTRTRVPAELLELPRQPVDDFPDDPFSQPDARAKSLAAARRHSAWIDGTVTLTRDGFALDVRLESPGRAPVRVHGEGKALVRAVIAVTDALAAREAIPKSLRVDAELARWAGYGDVTLWLDELDFFWCALQSSNADAQLARLGAARKQLGPRWTMLQHFASSLLGSPPPTSLEKDLLPPDMSQPEQRALVLSANVLFADSAAKGRIADELATLRRSALDEAQGRFAWAVVALTSYEALARYQGGDVERARQLVLWLAEYSPRDTDWSLVQVTTTTGKPLLAGVRATLAWMPGFPDAWSSLALTLPPERVAEKLRLMRRAVLLSAARPLQAVTYAWELVLDRQPVRARSFAAGLTDGERSQPATVDTILALVDLGEAQFEAAFKRARATLLTLPELGNLGNVDHVLMLVALGSSSVLGREQSLADEIAERFVLTEPPRVAHGHFAPMSVTNACVFASPAVAARCFERLHALIASGWFTEGMFSVTAAYAEAGERYARGDFAGAAEAYRPLLAAHMGSPFAALVFERAGDSVTSSKLDLETLAARPLMNGATLATVREARRAFARQDWGRAKTLAETIVSAWENADVKVAMLDEMRALIAQIPLSQASP